MLPGNPIRILTVEDHPVFREGLATIIGSQPDMLLVGQAENAAQAVTEFRRHRPHITLMDLRLPGTNGTDTLITIRGEWFNSGYVEGARQFSKATRAKCNRAA